MDYAKSLRDPRWQKKRLRILERDQWTCRDTHKTDEELHVHHCWYAKGGPWETPDEYLITLTKEAHKKRQNLEARAKKALGMILANTQNDYPYTGGQTDLEALVNTMEAVLYSGIECMPRMLDYIQFNNWWHESVLKNHEDQRIRDSLPEIIWNERGPDAFCVEEDQK